MLSLIVNADDFGYCKRRNKGIIELIKNGVVTRTSLLMNAMHTTDAIDGLLRMLEDDGLSNSERNIIGLHLNLTEGKPLSPLNDITSLVNEHGHFLGKFGFRDKIGEKGIVQQEVKIEIIAQIECFKERLGYLPTFVDGHQHVHILSCVRTIFGSILKSYGISKTRLPSEMFIDECYWLDKKQLTFYKQVCMDAINAVPVFNNFNIGYPDFFVGLSTTGANMQESIVRNVLQRVLEKVESDRLCSRMLSITPINIEFMVHPGYKSLPNEGGCGDGPDDFSVSAEREEELKFLNSKLRSIIQDFNLKLN